MGFTEKEVRAKVKAFVSSHPSQTAAAKAAKITRAELSIAVQPRGRMPAKLLKAVGVKKVEIYTNV